MAYNGVIVYIEAPAQNSEISFQGWRRGKCRAIKPTNL
jgi:hypothetical protein